MKIIKGVVCIGDSTSMSVGIGNSNFRDEDGTSCEISNKTIIRLYECIKFDMVRKGIDFDKYCDELFKIVD